MSRSEKPVDHMLAVIQAFEELQAFNRDLAVTVAAYVRNLQGEGLTRAEAMKLAMAWQTEFVRFTLGGAARADGGEPK